MAYMVYFCITVHHKLFMLSPRVIIVVVKIIIVPLLIVLFLLVPILSVGALIKNNLLLFSLVPKLNIALVQLQKLKLIG